jgi:hypothetical protein
VGSFNIISSLIDGRSVSDHGAIGILLKRASIIIDGDFAGDKITGRLNKAPNEFSAIIQSDSTISIEEGLHSVGIRFDANDTEGLHLGGLGLGRGSTKPHLGTIGEDFSEAAILVLINFYTDKHGLGWLYVRLELVIHEKGYSAIKIGPDFSSIRLLD